jgi:hypothetical protein
MNVKTYLKKRYTMIRERKTIPIPTVTTVHVSESIMVEAAGINKYVFIAVV